MISKTIGFRGLAYFQTHPYYSNIDGHYNQKLYIKLLFSDVSIDQTGATALLAVPSGPQLRYILSY